MGTFKEQLRTQPILKGLKLLHSNQICEAVKWFDLGNVDAASTAEKGEIAEAFYQYAKVLLQRRDTRSCVTYFQKSLELKSDNKLLKERIRLLRDQIMRSESLIAPVSLSEFATRLEINSVGLKHYPDKAFFQYAIDHHLIAPWKETVASLGCHCKIAYMGRYYPYQHGHLWTRAIRHHKQQAIQGITEALATLISEYLFLKTDAIAQLDYIVPIPPDPTKFVSRNLLAPNDLLAKFLSPLISAPTIAALSRTGNFPSTREASLLQKMEMYKLEDKFRGTLTGKGILLIEDVTTSGETLLACLKRCRDCKPSSINVVILGKTSGGV